ncbi:hypothetical protein D9M68_883030 [compost metagenome]
MAEQIVEHVGFDDVVELVGLANPVGDGKAPVGQQVEERTFRNEAGHGHNFPTGRGPEALVDFLEARNAVLHAQRGERLDEGVTGQAWQQRGLALVEATVGVMVGLGVGGPVLWAGVVDLRA